MEIGGIVLYKILENPSNSLESWTKIKNIYFTGEYQTIYSNIAKFYDKHSYLPCFSELILSIRDGLTKSKINALSKLDIPKEIPLELAVIALTDEFAQSETLRKLDKFVDGIHTLDSEEIKDELATLLLYLEEKTHSPDSIVTMRDLSIMEEEEVLNDLIPLGFNSKFDEEIMMATTELLMPGGYRGSGKSVVCTNMVAYQYETGNTSLYFSIEMRRREPFNRIMSMLSGVDATKLRFGKFTPEEYNALAETRCGFFEDGQESLDIFYKNRDFAALERDLRENRILKPDNQIIIIDDQTLTLMDIDMSIQKYKAQFGDKLKLVVVDYVNQIQIEDIYNWQSQIKLSKGLKDLARKYDVAMVSPYQIDKTGEARFSKGILDSADLAMTLKATDKYIEFECTKIRGAANFKLASGMDWKTLKIDPTDIKIEQEDEDPKESKANSFKKEDDIPF